MREEYQITPVQLDNTIKTYLALSSEKQVHLWTQDVFVKALPDMMVRLLTTESPQETRQAFYDTCISALTELRTGATMRDKSLRKNWKEQDPESRFIPASKFNTHPIYDEKGKKVGHENLFRLILAGTLALGISVDSDESPQTQRLLTPLSNSLAMAQAADMLIAMNSDGRQWIIREAQAAGITEKTFDRTLARLLLSLHKGYNNKGQLTSLPPQLKDAASHSIFAMEEFIDFAVQAVEAQKFTPNTARELVEFVGLIRQTRPQLLEQRYIKDGLSLILGGVNPKLQENNSGEIPNARETLGSSQRVATRRHIRWFDVQGERGHDWLS